MPAALDDFDGSPDRIDLDSRHSNSLVDERAALVALVVADLALADLLPALLELDSAEPIDFVAAAATPVDSDEFLGCIDFDSRYPSFLVDAPVDFLDFQMPVVI